MESENEKVKEEREELISDAEMSALLHDGPQVEGSVLGDRDKRHRIVPYNFRRPDRLSKEQVRSLYLMHDLLAKVLSSSLPLFLRTMCEVNLISVEQQSFGDYVRGMPDPTTIAKISADQLKGTFAIEINSSIAFPIVDRMLVGEGNGAEDGRSATELEIKVLEGFLKVITDSYCEVWRPVIEFKADVTGHETSPQLFQMVAPNEVVITILYQMQVGEARGSMSICLPIGILEGVIEKFTQSKYSSQKTPSPEATNALLKKLAEVNFPVAANLDRVPAAVSDLMELSVGDIIRTYHRVDRDVNVQVGDAVRFTGRIAALDGRIVVQMTEKRSAEAEKES
jgi:flagellar motor switch protein FliM